MRNVMCDENATVPGSESVANLLVALRLQFGRSLSLLHEMGNQTDTFGWKIEAAPRYLFSVSTHAGELPSGIFDFQVFICDDSMENGDFVYLEEVPQKEVVKVTQEFAIGSRT